MMEPAQYLMGFLMDPYQTLNLETDTSLLCIDELQRRGHRVFWLETANLDLVNGELQAGLREVLATSPLRLGAEESGPLSRLDGLLIRKDPPFDDSYLHLTYLLDFLPPGVVCVNSPRALRNINEKLATFHWPAYCPDSLVTFNPNRLLSFARRYQRILVKPLDECSGRGIRFFNGADPDLASQLVDVMRSIDGRQRYMLAQEYLPAVSAGDKRVYLLGQQPVGWVNRIPAPGSDLANIHQGARCEATELTNHEREVCTQVGQWLLAQGVLLAGLDFIGGRLTEINVTSPSAVRQINAVMQVKLEIQLVDGLLESLDRAQSR